MFLVVLRLRVEGTLEEEVAAVVALTLLTQVKAELRRPAEVRGRVNSGRVNRGMVDRGR